MLYEVIFLFMISNGCQSKFLKIDDMKMTEEEFYSTFETLSPRGSINTKHPYRHIWDVYIENGQYRIPYSWNSVPAATRGNISEAFDYLTKHGLCFKFVERTLELEYIKFIDNPLEPGCWSYIGRVHPTLKPNEINIENPGCVYSGLILHEIMHALGFYHEHNRPDRDDYIRIVWRNIKSGADKNFLKESKDEVNSMGVRYDYHSIMHYHPSAFGVKGSATIQFANGSQIPTSFYQRSRLTELDLKQLKLLYPCPAVKTTTTTTTKIAVTEAVKTTTTTTTKIAVTEAVKTTTTTTTKIAVTEGNSGQSFKKFTLVSLLYLSLFVIATAKQNF